MDSETPYYLAFARVKGIGAARQRLLHRQFGSLAAAWSATEGELLAAGLDERSLRALIDTREKVSPEKELAAVSKAGIRTVCLGQPGYPPLLAQAENAPPCLWLRGDIVESDALAVAIVGTRAPSVYGRDVAAQLAEGLAKQNVTIVSGLARGIDAVAHTSALAAGGRTLAVLGSGVDVIYPTEHRKLAADIAANGAVISDYPLGTKPDAVNFPPRNRIISGLSLGVVVVEADEKSGAIITTNYAGEQGRDVFAVPGNIFSKHSRGTNKLIQQGAKLVTSVNDVLEELNLGLALAQAQARSELPPADNDAERDLIANLSHEPVPVDDLVRITGMPTDEVTSHLIMLELKGMVRAAGAGGYVLAGTLAK